MNKKIDYAKLDFKSQQHHKRYEKFVTNRRPKLGCQECGAEGGWTEPVLDDGRGPFEGCGWCEGTGLLTPHMRGFWLRSRKEV